MLREIFTVLDESEKYYKISLDDENHPIFKAHFPENPILPGFVLLDIAFGLFGQKDKEIKRAKFLHQIPPKSILELKLEDTQNSAKIVVLLQQKRVTEIVYAK